MAQLNSRGTLTRSRWDYFEHSNGVASLYGSVTSGFIGAYFANNSSGATAIDIYTLNWSASVANVFTVSLLQPPLVLAALAPIESHIFALAADVATPPGINGMFTNFASPALEYVRYSAGSTGAQVSPILGDYFATLPPGWAISVSSDGSANPCELSMTVWYQYVTDNIAPAP
jgi:hypothetical protein